MSSSGDGIAFQIQRLRDFLGVFRRSKRGMLGIAIIIFFVVIAVAAPMLTPYSPTTIHFAPKTSYRLCKPVWYKYLFPGENSSENIDPIPDPYFNTATAIEKLTFDTSLAGQSSIHAESVSDLGYPEGSGPGCVSIQFERGADVAPYGEFEVSLTKVFNYPYQFPPKQFQGQMAMLVDNPQNVSVKVGVVLEKVGSDRRIVWVNILNSSTVGWIVPTPPDPVINSHVGYTREWLKDTLGPEWGRPEKAMFSESGDYRYGVEMTFDDMYPGENVEVTVYIDDLYLRIFGDSFGLLGSDGYGRDVFTQLIHGARISLIVGLLTAVLSTVVGLVVGLTAGYVGGYVDNILMRFTDLLLVIPDTALYIVLMAVLSPTIWNLVLLITVLGWTGFARVVRSQALTLKERPFVEAARAVGGGRFHIILKHILPNVMSLTYVALATAVPAAIIAEAWLSWLGLYDPTIMTWGRMLYDAQAEPAWVSMWWWTVPPGLCIAAISLSFILIGYALDEILNPKLRERR